MFICDNITFLTICMYCNYCLLSTVTYACSSQTRTWNNMTVTDQVIPTIVVIVHYVNNIQQHQNWLCPECFSVLLFNFKHTRVSRDFDILLRFPFESSPHTEKIRSTNACAAGAATKSSAINRRFGYTAWRSFQKMSGFTSEPPRRWHMLSSSATYLLSSLTIESPTPDCV